MQCFTKFRLTLLLFIWFPLKINSEVFEGLTLFSPSDGNPLNNVTYLMNNQYEIVHQWTHPSRPASIPYLFPDSTMLYPCMAENISMPVAASGGRIIKYDWDGNILWDFNWSDFTQVQHHDIEPLPNGNILLISNERKTMQDGIDKGRVNIEGEIWPDMIVEIQPFGFSGGNVIWEWHFWDHLIQDIDSTKPNFGNISDHPEKLDINAGEIKGYSAASNEYSGDWMHANSVHYNAELDQIVISCRRLNEFFIIDHSTTTAQASSSYGGNSGMGGDFLYRWGNPQNYGRGDSTTQKTFSQHSVHWIPTGYNGENNILIFNNGIGDTITNNSNLRSSIIEIRPPLNHNNTYDIIENQAFGPIEPEWYYDGSEEFEFLCMMQGGAFRLPNGNTIITTMGNPTIFEINYSGEIEWELNLGMSFVARAQKYGFDYFTSFIPEDINEDNMVNITDILIMINYILGENSNLTNGDLNSDNYINIIDIFFIIVYINS